MADPHRVVAVTRAERGEAARLLEAAGLRVQHLPAITLAAPTDPEPLKQAVAKQSQHDDLVFTSPSAVGAFIACADGLGLPRFGSARIVAVGTATAAAIEQAGGTVSLVGEGGGAALARHPALGPLEGRRILFPRAEQGREDFPEAARAAGARVTCVAAYRTLERPEAGEALRSKIESAKIAAVCFASPSAVRAIARGLGDARANLLSRVVCAAIGDTTAAALHAAGARRVVVATRPSAEALASAVLESI